MMMNRGTKRLATPDNSAPDSNDSALQSKRVMAATPFDVRRPESTRQHLMAEPPLDVQRAELCHQHVRALNTQFTSWVQSQLRNHPDELWEDGVTDYLTHASHIMEKFSDVVAWLRANAVKAESATTSGLPNSQNNLVDGVGSNKSILHPSAQSGFAKEGTVSSFPNAWSSGLSSGSQTQMPAFTGTQIPTIAKSEAGDDVDEEDDREKQSSPSLKKTEEKGIVVVHEVKCKVYVKSENPADKGWKDMGIGQLSIKCREGAGKGTKESKPIIVIRNDVGKILLNALIYPGIKVDVRKNTIASIFHSSGGGFAIGNEEDVTVARTYLLRTKTEDDTGKLAATIKEYAPSA